FAPYFGNFYETPNRFVIECDSYHRMDKFSMDFENTLSLQKKLQLQSLKESSCIWLIEAQT
ncbi:MAG: hypothetical protein ACKOW8_13225, partial [Flavobacteriales bacterium]